MNRRHFIQQVVLAGGILALRPWQIMRLIGRDHLPSAMQQLLDWDVQSEVEAATIPQYFQSVAPVEIPFRDSTLLAANSGSAGRTVATSTSVARSNHGTSTVAAAPGQASGNVRCDMAGTWSWSPHAYIAVLLYVADRTKLLNITIYTSSQTTVTTKFLSVQASAAALVDGWNVVYKLRSGMTVNGGELVTDPIRTVMVRCDSNASGDVTVNWDSVWLCGQHRPKHIWWFDDGFDGVFTIAYPYLAAAGIKASLAINRDLIGGANYMSLTQLQTLYAAGWKIANHTTSHVNLTTLGTAAEMAAIITPNTTYLRDVVGVTDGLNWFVPPQGGMNALATATVLGLGFTRIRGATAIEGTIFMKPLGATFDPQVELMPCRAADVAFALASWKGEIDEGIGKNATYQTYNHRPVASGAAGTQVNDADVSAMAKYLAVRSPSLDIVTFIDWDQQITGRHRRS